MFRVHSNKTELKNLQLVNHDVTILFIVVQGMFKLAMRSLHY